MEQSMSIPGTKHWGAPQLWYGPAGLNPFWVESQKVLRVPQHSPECRTWLQSQTSQVQLRCDLPHRASVVSSVKGGG